MYKKFFIYILFLYLINIIYCDSGPTLPEEMQWVKNHHIKWDGNYFGLTPFIISPKMNELVDNKEMTPHLIEALKDHEKFIAAHVLLTFLYKLRYKTFPEWNGLSVNVKQDGTIEIDHKQRKELYRRWKVFIEPKPLPDQLPL